MEIKIVKNILIDNPVFKPLHIKTDPIIDISGDPSRQAVINDSLTPSYYDYYKTDNINRFEFLNLKLKGDNLYGQIHINTAENIETVPIETLVKLYYEDKELILIDEQETIDGKVTFNNLNTELEYLIIVQDLAKKYTAKMARAKPAINDMPELQIYKLQEYFDSSNQEYNMSFKIKGKVGEIYFNNKFPKFVDFKYIEGVDYYTVTAKQSSSSFGYELNIIDMRPNSEATYSYVYKTDSLSIDPINTTIKVIELPRYIAESYLTPFYISNLKDPNADMSAICVHGLRPISNAVQFDFMIKNNETYNLVDTLLYSTYGVLSENMSKTDNTIKVINYSDKPFFRNGDLIYIDDELMIIDEFDNTLNTITVRRGVLDTYPTEHISLSKIYFINKNAFVNSLYEPAEYNAKVLTDTFYKKQSVNNVSDYIFETTGRTTKPLNVSNVKFNNSNIIKNSYNFNSTLTFNTRYYNNTNDWYFDHSDIVFDITVINVYSRISNKLIYSKETKDTNVYLHNSLFNDEEKLRVEIYTKDKYDRESHTKYYYDFILIKPEHELVYTEENDFPGDEIIELQFEAINDSL